jgi:alpha-D-ribose 1-methylphosphonate 5-triphosphate synthase subunit PhnL
MSEPVGMLRVRSLAKKFVLHNQGGIALPVLAGVDMSVAKGEAVVLTGDSGVGKSTLLRMLYGNYRPSAGQVEVRHGGRFVDIVSAEPRTVLEVRRRTLGWVSQFLRVIPRVTTLDIVRDPLLMRGVDSATATARARAMLARLNLPERLWNLAPATFSGGEQQRVNIARSFVDPAPILLLDEPTASLDANNRGIVVELVNEARARGAAIVGIFHDEATRERIATRTLDLTRHKAA